MVDLSSILDAYLRRESEPPKPDVFHASELAYCLRQSYLRRVEPREWPSSKLRIFQSGNLVHELVRRVLSEADDMGVTLVDYERPFEFIFEDFSIRGRMDDLVWIRTGGDKELVPIEVKSVGAPFRLDQLAEPTPEHVCQLTVYLRAARVQRGIIWYLERSYLTDKWFWVSYSKKLFDLLVDRARTLYGYLLRRELPPAESQLIRPWECAHCLYRATHCNDG